MKDPHAATRAFETRAIHAGADANPTSALTPPTVSYTHLRAHETDS